MFRRQPAAGTPAYESKGCPYGAASCRSTPLLPRLLTPDVRTGRESASEWWQNCQRLPYVSPGVPYGPRGRGTLRALLLPPLQRSDTAREARARGAGTWDAGARGAGARGAGTWDAGARGAGARGAGTWDAGARGAGARESGAQDAGPRGAGVRKAEARGAGARGVRARATRQPAARDHPDTLGALLKEFLPTKFRDFLHQLRAKCAEPEAHPPSPPQYPKGASEHCLNLRRPSCSFLPDPWDQSLHSEDSFREKPTLGPPRGEFNTARKANPPSGEGTRPRRRYCPFRVRFADETLQDTALRYWERNRAVRQNIFPCEQTALPAVSVSAQEPQLYLSEDAPMSSSLPFISRATTLPRPQGGLRTFLDIPNTVEQESFLPSLVLQSVLKRGHPKGYRLLPSTNRQQAQR